MWFYLVMKPNGIGASMVSMLALTAVYHGFNPRPGQAKTIKLILAPVIMQHKSLNSDGQQFHYYQQNEQSPSNIKSGFMLTSVLISVRVQKYTSGVCFKSSS